MPRLDSGVLGAPEKPSTLYNLSVIQLPFLCILFITAEAAFDISILRQNPKTTKAYEQHKSNYHGAGLWSGKN